MSLLASMIQRGGMPSANELKRQQGGGDMPPMRGVMTWQSGFEDQQRKVLEELMRAAQMRDQATQMNLQNLIPMLMVRGGG
jgi:hypothetical protein